MINLSLGIVQTGSKSSGPTPVLDISFLNGTLDPRITFTSSGGGSYTDISGNAQTAGVNQPRFDYDATTHVSKGLLIGTNETAVMSGTNFSSWYNPSAGTFVLDLDQPTPAFSYILGWSGTAHTPAFVNNATSLSSYDGTSQIDATSGAGDVTIAGRFASSYDATGRAVCFKGGTVVTSATTYPTSQTSLYIGCQGIGAQVFNGHIQRLRYYAAKLSNSQLVSLST